MLEQSSAGTELEATLEELLGLLEELIGMLEELTFTDDELSAARLLELMGRLLELIIELDEGATEETEADEISPALLDAWFSGFAVQAPSPRDKTPIIAVVLTSGSR